MPCLSQPEIKAWAILPPPMKVMGSKEEKVAVMVKA
jgi:hypothetical protein